MSEQCRNRPDTGKDGDNEENKNIGGCELICFIVAINKVCLYEH